MPTPQPFTPRFDGNRVELLKKLASLETFPKNANHLPGTPVGKLGIDLPLLKDLKARLEAYDVGRLEAKLAQFQHFTVPINDTTIHFVHERSERADAVPLLLLHGWPGLFHDFHRMIKELANPADPTETAFNVVVPSMPGYAWSEQFKQEKWNLQTIADTFNKLMVDVLGYRQYAGQGGDWGSMILRYIGINHGQSALLAHFNMFFSTPPGLADWTPMLKRVPFMPESVAELLHNIAIGAFLSKQEITALKRVKEYIDTGSGYFQLQSTKPDTIGYALSASPLALLAYIGEKFLMWSEPELRTNPEFLDDVISTVVIYYLTDCIASSVLIYHNALSDIDELRSTRIFGAIKSHAIGFSAFPFEILSAPRSWIARHGNLRMYKVHEKGGHFPGFDNPEGLVGDIRDFVGSNWKEALAGSKA